MAKRETNENLPVFVQAMSKVKIGTRINLIFLLIICAIAAPVIILVSQSVKYMKIYNDVLDNLESINYIMNETKQQGNRILGYCVVNKNIDESGETEIMVKMQNEIEKIRGNIGTDQKYNKNLQRLEIVENLLDNYVTSYKEGVGLCSDTFSLSGDTRFYSMVNTAEYLSKNCNELLSLELKRSADLKDSISSNFQNMIMIILIIVAIVIVISILLSVFLKASITMPIKILKNHISIVSKGDLSGASIHIATKDEIRDLAESYNIMKDNLKNILERVSGVTAEIEESVDFVTNSVETNSTNSEEISTTVDVMLQHLEQQNEETLAAQDGIHRINSVSVKISNNADKSLNDSKMGNKNITLYTEQLKNLNEMMNEVSDVVKELGGSAKEMTDIINTITDISEQTNLLSLNAAIEAAKAGDSGRGFAVVANEISNLADHSNVSAQKIGDIIMEVQNKMQIMTEKMHNGLEQLEEGNKIANHTSKSFNNIQRGIEVVNENVKEIINDISNLSENIQTILVNMDSIHDKTNENVSVTTQIVSSLHEETQNLVKVADTMGELSGRAKELEQTVLKFKLR